jgi:hypothetical protein
MSQQLKKNHPLSSSPLPAKRQTEPASPLQKTKGGALCVPFRVDVKRNYFFFAFFFAAFFLVAIFLFSLSIFHGYAVLSEKPQLMNV